MKWHRLQEKKEHRLNARGKEVVLRATEYQDKVLECEAEQGQIFDENDEDVEKRSIGDLLDHMEDSEQQEDLMTEASSETKRSYDFKSDNLCINAGYAGLIDDELPHEDNNTEISINEIAGGMNLDLEKDQELNGCSIDDDEVKYHDECISDEDSFELMQQKELIDSLFNEGNAQNEECFIGDDEIIVSHIENLIIDENIEDFTFSGSQKDDKVQMLKTVEKECSQHKECLKEEDGTYLSHIKEEFVRELNKAKLATRVSQRDDGGQLLKVVKKKEGNAKVRHCDETLRRCQGEVELLEYLPEESEYRSEIAVSNRKVSQALVGTETYASSQNYDVFVGVLKKERMNMILQSKR